MPLTTTADLGHHNMNRNIVRFFMENETKERIRCGVTIRASKSLNQTSIQELTRCRPACGWNLRGAISGNLKLSDQAARSIG